MERWKEVLGGISTFAGLLWLVLDYAATGVNRIETIGKGIDAGSQYLSQAPDPPQSIRIKPVAPPLPAPIETSSPRRCTAANSIEQAFSIVGPPPFAAKIANFSAELAGREICGQGWPAVVLSKFYIEPIDEWAIDLAHPGSSDFVLKVLTKGNHWQLQRDDAVWVTGELTRFSEGEYLAAKLGKILSREVIGKTSTRLPKPREEAPAQMGQSQIEEWIKRDWQDFRKFLLPSQISPQN